MSVLPILFEPRPRLGHYFRLAIPGFGKKYRCKIRKYKLLLMNVTFCLFDEININIMRLRNYV